MLEKPGHRPTAVGSGRAAVAALRDHRFDLVLMDIEVPELDGVAATRQIRELEARQPGAGRVPIIGLTAHALKGDRERFLAAGMDGYLSKPFKVGELLEAIGRIVPPGPAEPARPQPPPGAPPDAPSGGPTVGGEPGGCAAREWPRPSPGPPVRLDRPERGDPESARCLAK